MRKSLPNLLASAFLAAPFTVSTEDVDPELAFMPRTMAVTLRNEGGKYVAVDLKHIPEGGNYRMDKDATIVHVEPGATPGRRSTPSRNSLWCHAAG
jgi:hypothetical protein